MIPSFATVWSGRGRLPDTLGARDTWRVASDGSGLASLSALVRTAGGPEHGCQYGCAVGDGWLAVADGPPDAATGADWRLAAGAGADWDFAGATLVEDAATLRSAGAALFYTRPLPGSDPTGAVQYEVRRRELAPGGADEALFRFPPDGEVTGSLFRGAFHVSADGRTLALLRPTLRSQWLYVWDAAAGLRRLDEACWRTLGGSCQGAGDFYADADPLALAADGAQVAWFVVTDGALEARLLEVATGTRRSAVLAAVPPGQDWARDACAVRAPGQPLAVTGRPWLVDGGATLLFAGRAECGTGKPESDVFALSTALLGDRAPLVPDDLVNLTQVPKTGGPEQLVIEDLALDPDQTTLVFTATPAMTADGTPLPAGSSRHSRDTEIWVQLRAGGPAHQLTDDADFTAEGVRTVAP